MFIKSLTQEMNVSTVGDLRKVLADLPDDMPIGVGHDNDEGRPMVDELFGVTIEKVHCGWPSGILFHDDEWDRMSEENRSQWNQIHDQGGKHEYKEAVVLY